MVPYNGGRTRTMTQEYEQVQCNAMYLARYQARAMYDRAGLQGLQNPDR